MLTVYDVFLCSNKHEYMSYMEKKTSKRQTTIVTLSDHNKQEIRNIQLQRQVMEEEFDDKKKGTCGLIESMADVSYNFLQILLLILLNLSQGCFIQLLLCCCFLVFFRGGGLLKHSQGCFMLFVFYRDFPETF